MNFIQLTGALELGLIYALIGMGTYLTFRVLQFPDMTVDGSYVLGASVFAILAINDVHPLLATLCAIAAGCVAGYVTAFLSTKLKMLNLLAGILTMTALYSINLRVMGGRPNIALSNSKSILEMYFPNIPAYVPLGLIAVMVAFGLWAFLKTDIGLSLRSTGNNPKMTRAQGVSDQKMICLGLAIANGLVALAGALFAQYNGFSDINLGVGTIVTGLAAVIIGEAIFSTQGVIRPLLSCIGGSIIFYLVTAMALNFHEIGLQAYDQKMVMAVLVAVAMFVPKFRQSIMSTNKNTPPKQTTGENA
jgi:putative ABC transport system permease protein